jgi:hypothetical protein
MNNDRILNISDACDLAAIIHMAQGTQKVARLLDSGDVVYGTARSIGTENGGFAGGGDDVRDAFLRVTLSGGFEAFWPVSDLLPLVRTGEFTTYDW